MGVTAKAKWKPPADPDPRKILNEAEADAKAGNYADALAKHVWFHENALLIRESLYGVRLSFALSSWRELAHKYPPASGKLKAVRDEAMKNVREGKEPYACFHDAESINETLGEEEKTRELFIWLHEHSPAIARHVFNLAEDALVRAKEYKLCGKYLEPEKYFERAVDNYRFSRRMAKERKNRKPMRDYAEKSFSNSCATIIALLVLNDRKAEAEKIAASAVREWKDPEFAKQLKSALSGNVPQPWP